jgi:FAD/FMN-containing dehydrogenase
MTAIQTSPSSVDALRRRLRGTVIEPGGTGWDAATLAYNTTVTQEPALVALPENADDVGAIVRFARENGLQVAPQRAGHNAEPLGSLDDVILLRTDRLQGASIDPERRTARVAGGAKWGDVVPRASELGLAALHGSTPDVSVAGYSLGGGIGWYARKLGLAANSVRAIELVTADGELRRVDHESEPDLFWALRGGGGSFGVVTALEIELFPIAEVYAGVLFFPWERSADVLHAWNEWRSDVPEEVTSVGRILQFPPLPEVPDELRGKQFAVVEAVALGNEALGAEILEPLRALGPALDTFAMVPPVGIAELHMDPPEPVPYTADGMMLRELPPAAIDAVVAATGPESGSSLVSFEIRHLGGALFRSDERHGALDTFDAEFLTDAVGVVLDDDSYRASRADIDAVREALAPYDAGRRYLNFTEEPTDVSSFYRPEAFARLQAVKAAVDPQDVFRSNHPIPAA